MIFLCVCERECLRSKINAVTASLQMSTRSPNDEQYNANDQKRAILYDKDLDFDSLSYPCLSLLT
ncbi:MAG: hypothetical protein ACI90V_012705 [Bacillariaceae sp.]|jgi:hypothetical protein